MKKSFAFIIVIAIIATLLGFACKLETPVATAEAVTSEPTMAATSTVTPTPAPTSEPTAEPTATPTATPQPTSSPTPQPTYTPPEVSFDGQHVDIGKGWITVDLPEGFESYSLTDGELFTAYYMGDESEGVYSIKILQAFAHDLTSYAKASRLDEYLAHMEYQDSTVTRLNDVLTFGSVEGYHSMIEGFYQVEQEICHMLVALSEGSYYVLYIYGTPDGVLQDDTWVKPIIDSFHIDAKREKDVYRKRFKTYDDATRILRSEYAPCQITLPKEWRNAPIEQFLNGRYVMAGEHMDGNKVFHVYQFRNDANPYEAMDVSMEQFMITDRMIALSNNHLINSDTELVNLPANDSDDPWMHYLLRPSDDFVIAFAILEGEETSYLLELWSYTADIMTEEAILELLNTFSFDYDVLPTQNT